MCIQFVVFIRFFSVFVNVLVNMYNLHFNTYLEDKSAQFQNRTHITRTKKATK